MSEFQRFGVKSFTGETKSSEFAAYLERGQFITTRCKQCRAVSFPPRVDCPECRSSDVEWIEVTEKGRLQAFTVVHYGPAGFEDRAPYTLGVVGFPMGIKVLGEIDEAIPTGEIKVGMVLRVVPIRLNGERVSYHFEKD